MFISSREFSRFDKPASSRPFEPLNPSARRPNKFGAALPRSKSCYSLTLILNTEVSSSLLDVLKAGVVPCSLCSNINISKYIYIHISIYPYIHISDFSHIYQTVEKM